MRKSPLSHRSLGWVRLSWACLMGGWVGVSHASPPVRLEVLGRLEVQTSVETLADDNRLVRGRLSDELGKPIAGTVTVKSARGRPLAISQCPTLEPAAPMEDSDPPLPASALAVGATGEFCFLTDGSDELVLHASAEHFVEIKHDVSSNLPHELTRPIFSQAPTSIDLFDDSSQVVELLLGDTSQAPEGANVSLSIRCDKEEALIDRAPLAKSRLARFEWDSLELRTPGTCQFIAQADAPSHLPIRATRSVLVRDRITLALEDIATTKKLVHLDVRANGSEMGLAEGRLDSGLVEARTNGAFLALAPIEKGRAIVELSAESSARDIELVYVSSTPSLLPADSLFVNLPGTGPGFRWESIHTIGLVLFAMWLSYAWLRPGTRAEARAAEVPPREPLIRETGKRSGPVQGRVLDSHTGEPLARARIRLEAVGPAQTLDLEEAVTQADGSFTFRTKLEDHPVLRVVATRDEYMALALGIRSSQFTVHLAHRRRALVQNLVGWAREVGAPWIHRRGPTPGDVERTAHRLGRAETAEWARAVATAAYSPDDPSEDTVLALRGPASAAGLSTGKPDPT